MRKRDLPAALMAGLKSNRQALRLDLSTWSVDLLRLQAVAKACTVANGMLSADLIAEAMQMLEETVGEFLPDWEQIEEETTGSRGAAGELVRSLREVAETARVDIMAVLAANHLAHQDPTKAIPLLEQALER
jgi:hypothetical protein